MNTYKFSFTKLPDSGGNSEPSNISVINNLVSTSETDALSASMGKKLNDKKQDSDTTDLNTVSNNVVDAINELLTDTETMLAKAKAYTDTQTQKTANIPIYLLANGLSFTAPTGVGTELTINATTTEQVVYDKSIPIGRVGQVSPNNIYAFLAKFRSVSSSRITYLRVRYYVGNTEIINKEIIMQNTTADLEVNLLLPMNKLGAPLDYIETDNVRVVVSIWLSNATDTLYMLLGDSTNTTQLIRMEPISGLFATTEYVDNAIQQAILNSWEESV